MLYPCTNCLVDMICIDPCDKLIFYSDELVSTLIPRLIIKNETRLERMRICFKYASGSVNRRVKFDRRIIEIWNDMIAEKHYEKINKELQNHR